MKCSALRLLLLLVGVVLVAAAGAAAQSDTATISGRITDESGDVLVNVSVRLTDLDTGVDATTQTDAGGLYAVRNRQSLGRRFIGCRRR